MHIYDELSWRGLINQVSDEAKVRAYLDTPGRSLYCGFDPTAKSLHVGNLVPLLTLMRFQRAGHAPLVLLGGGTAMIGDPSGKDAERTLQAPEVIAASKANIVAQVQGLFQRGAGGPAQVVDNHDWIATASAIELLRDVGKYFTINWMLQKESVKNRIVREESGISYTEFSYMVLQGWDFSVLAEQRGCLLQVGGSDQWGNITAGTELIRKKLGKEAFALTCPLITTADGKKFGKSEKGAVYLDPTLTSPYDFYQFWVRVADADVIRFLRLFTFLPQEEVGALEQSVAERPEARVAQKRLAQEMTILVHGEAELAKVEAATAALFGGGELHGLDAATLRAACAECASVTYPSKGELPDLPQVLVDLKLCPSKGQARKDIQAGGVYVNNQRVQDPAYVPAEGELLHGAMLLVRKGKKNYGVVEVGE